MKRNPRILVFDSGVGGLSVVKAFRDITGNVDIAYAADNAAFPYGDWEEKALVGRMEQVMARLINQLQPDAIIIACNTASTIGLDAMRRAFDMPFVGTVPAIKPAANKTKTGLISVLATPGTVRREYTRALIDTYAYHFDVTLHGCENLAGIAEGKLKGHGVDLKQLAREVAPVFVENCKGRTDVVVLGCTHYPFLVEEISEVAPWPVEYVDPSLAIANQALRLLEKAPLHQSAVWEFTDEVMLSGKSDTPHVFAGFGLSGRPKGFDIKGKNT
jgi:glutamate racemase